MADQSPNEADSSGSSSVRVFAISVAACVVIAALAMGLVYLIRNTEPTAERSAATRKSAALVETITVTRGDFAPEIVALGRVTPAQEVALSPEVSGRVVRLSPNLIPGGYVSVGETLVEIDRADYENEVAIRESELETALSNLAIEEGRQAVAEKEFENIEDSVDPVNQRLILRIPQMAAAKAAVKAARAALDMAKLNLARTRIEAPFDAQVLTRSVAVGSQIDPSASIAHLVGIAEYWVIATVPLSALPVLPNLAADVNGYMAPVILRNRASWPDGATRTGSLARIIGALDQQTRLARIVISVPDPLARNSTGQPLLIDTIVECRIAGKPFPDVAKLKREFLRKDNTVWIFADGELEVRSVTVTFEDANHAYISEGLNDGDKVVTTALSAVANGIPLKEQDDQTSAETQP